MHAYATIRWDYVVLSGATLLFLVSAGLSARVAVRSIFSQHLRDTAFVALMDLKPGVHVTVWSSALAAIYFLNSAAILFMNIVRVRPYHLHRTLVIVQLSLLPLILLLAGYETLRWRLRTPREIRRRTRGGDYDLILAFILFLLLASLLIPFLPIPWRT